MPGDRTRPKDLPLIQTPEVAVAIALCLLAEMHSPYSPRALTERVTSRHPQPCDWCSMPRPRKVALLDEWNAGGGPGVAWQALPIEQQREAVAVAQGYRQGGFFREVE